MTENRRAHLKADQLARYFAIACFVVQPSACDSTNPTLNESPDWDMSPREPPVTPPPPARLERVVAAHVGREALLGGGNPKHWEKRCSIHRPCSLFKALRPCDAKLSALDSLPSSPIDRQGQVVALRGTLALTPVVTTAAGCEPKPHDPRQPCCNEVGTAAVIQCGDTAVVLDRLGCFGDESRLCCNTPAFGQAVVAVGKLVRFPPEWGGVEWQLDDPRLCLQAP